MSILINGMKMPKCCFDCSCLNDEYCQCQAIGKTIEVDWIEHRPDWCPLIEVPPHGRLIDADALKSYMEECKGENAMAIYATGYARSFIDNAPTVITADKDGGT